MSIVLIFWVISVILSIIIFVCSIKKIISGGRHFIAANREVLNYKRLSWRTRQEHPLKINYKNYVNGFNKNILDVRAYHGFDNQNPFTPAANLGTLKPAICRPSEDIDKERVAVENVKNARHERAFEKNRMYWKKWNEFSSWNEWQEYMQQKEAKNKEAYGYKNIYEKIKTEKAKRK